VRRGPAAAVVKGERVIDTRKIIMKRIIIIDGNPSTRAAGRLSTGQAP